MSTDQSPGEDFCRDWKVIPGYGGAYEVSDDGLVRSFYKRGSTERLVHGRYLKPRKRGATVNKKAQPYTYFALSFEGKGRPRGVHVLMAEAFLGPRPPGGVVRHLDGDGANNTIGNLTWGTYAENNQDTVRHGTHNNASKTVCIRGHELTPENTYVKPGGSARSCRTCRRGRPALLKAARVEVDGDLVALNAPSHGTESSYTNYGCRCPLCREVWAIGSRTRYERKKRAS